MDKKLGPIMPKWFDPRYALEGLNNAALQDLLNTHARLQFILPSHSLRVRLTHVISGPGTYVAFSGCKLLMFYPEAVANIKSGMYKHLYSGGM